MCITFQQSVAVTCGKENKRTNSAVGYINRGLEGPQKPQNKRG